MGRNGNSTEGMGLNLEQLESRLLMSGNITVSVHHGRLTIFGDPADNQITIDQASLSSGQDRISATDADTTINGQAGPLIFDGVKTIVVKLGDGNDKLDINGLTLSGGLHIDMGQGDNSASFKDVSVHRNATFRSGNGKDSVSVQSLWAHKIVMRTGGGDDNLTFGIDYGFQARKIRVNLGAGDDTLTYLSDPDPLAAHHPMQVIVPYSVISGGPGHDTIQGASLCVYRYRSFEARISLSISYLPA